MKTLKVSGSLCQQTSFSLTMFVCLQEMQVEELSAVRQALQADLETSIRRIVDLQAALEEVESSDESDTERYLCLCVNSQEW